MTLAIGGFSEALEVITSRALVFLEASPAPIILIDGRAGAGKSTFAKLLVDSLFRQGESMPRLIPMDELYPGWDLRGGSIYLEEKILLPIQNRQTANWQIYDWESGHRGAPAEPGNGWREFDNATPLIIEGCGSISLRSAGIASLKIWIEAPLESRKVRFHDRDQGAFDDHWVSWQLQEDEFYELEGSPGLADYQIQN